MESDHGNLHRESGELEGESKEEAINAVINSVKSQGLFDQFRKDCLADVDTKPAYHNLIQRVEKYVQNFLKGQKWSSNINKNQLRDRLKKQLNNSGMMNSGIERIIEQVVNPKILLGIKPKIDEAVSNHLGINLKEIQRRKQEQQRLLFEQHQQLQQQHMQNLINQKTDEEDDRPNSMPWPPPAALGVFPTTPTSNADNMPTSQGPPAPPFQIGPMGSMMHPYPGSMMAWPQGLPGMEGFNQTMPPMIPGHPMIPAPMGAIVPGFSAGESPSSTSMKSSFSSPTVPVQTSTTSVVPDLSKPPPMPSSGGITTVITGIPTQSSPRMHGLGTIAPSASNICGAPPGSIPPPPGTVPIIPSNTSPAVPTTPTIPALITHTLSKMTEDDDLTPEKIAVFKTAAAFIEKTVNANQSLPGADIATMFSPRVLAEAMMEESGPPLSKHDIRQAKRKERMKNLERLKEERDKEEKENFKKTTPEDKEDPLPPKSNLMDVFQGAEDVSDDEEALDMLMDVEEDDRHKQGVVLSEDSDEEIEPTSQPGKSQNFHDMELIL